MVKKTVLETESFAFFDNSRFMTTEYCKACITALAKFAICYSNFPRSPG